MAEKRVTVCVLRPKDRPTLQLQWVDPDTGVRKTKSAGTDDPDKAEQARADLEYQLNHGCSRSRASWIGTASVNCSKWNTWPACGSAPVRSIPAC